MVTLSRRETPYTIVHDHLVQRGGAERVVASMARLLDAEIRTSFYDPAATHSDVSECRVRPSVVNRIAWFRSHHRWSFPILAPLFSAMRPAADTTVLSTIGWAHFARPRGRTVAYWYAPARWLYQTDVYVGRNLKGRLVRALVPSLRWLDRRAVRRIDHHLAVSTEIAKRVEALYGIEANVVHPPVSFRAEPEPIDGIAPGFLLSVSRFLSYKNLDAVIQAMDLRPDLRLVIVGRGPDETRLRAMAGPNVRFVGQPTDDQLSWLYQRSVGLVTAAHEDFGLTPLEGAMFGTPTAALRAGGFLDTIVEGTTGIFFDHPEMAAIADAIDELLERSWDADTLRNQAARFSEAAFAHDFASALDDFTVAQPLRPVDATS